MLTSFDEVYLTIYIHKFSGSSEPVRSTSAKRLTYLECHEHKAIFVVKTVTMISLESFYNSINAIVSQNCL